MMTGREILERARDVPANLRRALDTAGTPAAALLSEALADLGRIEEFIGQSDAAQPVREVVRRYLARLRAAVEDLLARRLRGDPGFEEILAGEVLPLAEGLEGLCRPLPMQAFARPSPDAEEA